MMSPNRLVPNTDMLSTGEGTHAGVPETSTPQARYLFTDYRHIWCGQLAWRDSADNVLPCNDPPEFSGDPHATSDFLPRGVRIQAQQAEKAGKIADDYYAFGQVMFRVHHDGGMYRTWFLDWGEGVTKDRDAVDVMYMESDDGFAWRRKKSGSITDLPARGFFDGPDIFIDPVGPPEERYKLLYSDSIPNELRGRYQERYQQIHPRHKDSRRSEVAKGIYAAVSPDGLSWRSLPEPLLLHQGDVDNTVYYDDWLQRYVLYTRYVRNSRRWIGRSESEDFRRWTPVEPIVGPSLDWSLCKHVYGIGRSSYPGLPFYHFLLPHVYDTSTELGEVHMYTSDDGIYWHHLPGCPVLEPGADDEWDSGWIASGRNIVPFGSDRVGILYRGIGYPHKYPRWPHVMDSAAAGWATWPDGRMAAVVADKEGEFLTHPMLPAGRSLKLNARTGKNGAIQVELRVLDEQRNALGPLRPVVPGRSLADCDPVCGDGQSLPVHWGGETDIGTKAEQRVCLFFRLRQAELFGLEWE